MRVQTRVRGPHPGVRLAQPPLGGRLPLWETGSTGACAVAFGIQLQRRDGIAGRQALGVDANAGTELPKDPHGGSTGTAYSRAAQGCGFLESAPISIALHQGPRICSIYIIP
jgi:hypothetical protein